jgi:hypothetical protein
LICVSTDGSLAVAGAGRYQASRPYRRCQSL